MPSGKQRNGQALGWGTVEGGLAHPGDRWRGEVEREREGGQYPGPHLLTGTSRSCRPANLFNKPLRALGEGEACVGTVFLAPCASAGVCETPLLFSALVTASGY